MSAGKRQAEVVAEGAWVLAEGREAYMHVWLPGTDARDHGGA